ncbi:hypothetical protein [Elioraea tepidiphila]|jgi:hypothetical protein|uniref:hypothetical protein n=1 Tax=Elioraea tepidiphila TaxID=457934 RepID=UPI00035CEB83|nr:hypothetical protein [Elioraea tepidiphila]
MLRGLVPALAAVLLVSGCGAASDPSQREGTWRPSGANAANLRAMIVDPSHLRQGVGDPTGRGRQATNAIERLEDDDLKPLPDIRASQIGR